MKNNAYMIIGGNSVSLTLKGNPRMIHRTENPQIFTQLIEALKANNWKLVETLVDKPKAIAKYFHGFIKVENGVVKYKNRPIDNDVTKRIIEYMQQGLPFNSLVKFLGHLMKNPDQRCRQSLYHFMETEKLPIDDDGYIIAYKSLRHNFRDWHTDTIPHYPGTTVWWGQRKRERQNAPLNYGESCSDKGYHAGTWNYASTFHSLQESVLCLVRINPADVISVPNEGQCGKIRVKKYRIIELYKDGKPLPPNYFGGRNKK